MEALAMLDARILRQQEQEEQQRLADDSKALQKPFSRDNWSSESSSELDAGQPQATGASGEGLEKGAEPFFQAAELRRVAALAALDARLLLQQQKEKQRSPADDSKALKKPFSRDSWSSESSSELDVDQSQATGASGEGLGKGKQPLAQTAPADESERVKKPGLASRALGVGLPSGENTPGVTEAEGSSRQLFYQMVHAKAREGPSSWNSEAQIPQKIGSFGPVVGNSKQLLAQLNSTPKDLSETTIKQNNEPPPGYFLAIAIRGFINEGFKFETRKGDNLHVTAAEYKNNWYGRHVKTGVYGLFPKSHIQLLHQSVTGTALWDFDATRSGELSLTEGAKIFDIVHPPV
jgi:hypothetical protein